MTGKSFFNGLTNGKGQDALQLVLDLLMKSDAGYCLIGGLAVNAYADPVVSLDVDIVIAAANLEKVKHAALGIFAIEEFPHSINLNRTGSDLRIQFQTDIRYQDFLKRAVVKKVLGYDMRVAAIEDVLQGKLWAYADTGRRPSKRQKDLADIFRLVEKYPELKKQLPPEIMTMISSRQ
jgi:hypothetical protein